MDAKDNQMERIFSTAVTALIVTTVTGTAHAAMPPPSMPDSLPPGPSISHTVVSRGFQMGPFNIAFEETTLGAVQQAIGAGEIDNQGDAGDSEYWLCYTVADAKARGRIWIVAHGEMGGPEHDIGWVYAKLDNSAQPTTDCPALPAKFSPLSFDGQFWLGMQYINAVRILGSNGVKLNDWQVYDYLGKIPGNCPPDGFDLTSYLMFKSSHGILTSIVAGQVTTC